MPTVAVVGALDTKAGEYAFLCERLKATGIEPLVINFGVMGTPGVSPAIDAAEVATAGGADLQALRAANDRGAALAAMARGVATLLRRLYEEGRIQGAIGMGGSGGSSVIAAGLQALPVGVPKLLLSTVAAGDTRPYVGARDVVMMPSVVDIAGLNRLSRRIIANAAGALAGMLAVDLPAEQGDRPLIAASMFGNTTPCVDQARAIIEQHGYEVLVFHATGTGGKIMESLIADGFIAGVLDITTTEWADEVCGGVFSAGSSRLESAAARGVPQVVVPGCIDMVNFGPRSTVPERYRDRLFYEWNPTVTLMRTTPEENARMGEIFADKLNRATGPVRVLIPLRGFSMLDSPGERFWDPAADAAFVQALTARLRPDIPVEQHELNINDPAFAERVATALLELLTTAGVSTAQARTAERA
ncbi:Tm-1-like ATP-binding domain-containing protein [Kallotenue papyrolyticum]|uniref:Tm-1-like ATP-binding domain-containing protein n=1 Tax=Kallotenue papyrolyticum TaxID=1325125 RepID=UPI000470ACBE|nr:Tm-1-like ATP-binding domain-containing protein [Kallotenue papyrolyticum]